jgi:hypothetical protein
LSTDAFIVGQERRCMVDCARKLAGFEEGSNLGEAFGGSPLSQSDDFECAIEAVERAPRCGRIRCDGDTGHRSEQHDGSRSGHSGTPQP